MSAIGGLTYVYILDIDTATNIPAGDTQYVFANYNEAMSFCKFITSTFTGTRAYAVVWNYYGGSGSWNNGLFTSYPNQNWP